MMLGDTPKMADVTREVFSTPAGKKLLQLWEYYFVKGPMMEPSPYETYANIGRRDFILDVMRKATAPKSTK